jgi:hypothetical protein
MSTMWPSEKTRTTRASKAAPVKAIVPTDWVSGWLIMLMVLGMVAGVAALFWPIASHFVDSFQNFVDTMELATHRAGA